MKSAAVFLLLLVAALPSMAADAQPIDYEVLEAELAGMHSIKDRRRRLMQLLVQQPSDGSPDTDRLRDSYNTLKALESTEDVEKLDLAAWVAAALDSDEAVRIAVRIAAETGGVRPPSEDERQSIVAEVEQGGEPAPPPPPPPPAVDVEAPAPSAAPAPARFARESPRPLPAPEGAQPVAISKILGPDGAAVAVDDGDPIMRALSLLEAAGYSTHGRSNPLFDLDDRDLARVWLGGQVEAEHRVVIASDEPAWWMVARWELLDVATKRVVYQTRTNGVAPTRSGALDDALRALLARPAFSRQVLSNPGDPVEDPDESPLSFTSSKVCVLNAVGPPKAELQLDSSAVLTLLRRRYLCWETPAGTHELKIEGARKTQTFATEDRSMAVFELAGENRLITVAPADFHKRRQSLSRQSR